MLSDLDYSDVLAQLPKVEFAFAYGSGVVLQSGYDIVAKSREDATKLLEAARVGAGRRVELPMVDFILVVEDAERWHEENIRRNPSHYTPMLPLSARSIANIQNNYGAAIWFNTMIPMRTARFPSRHMKYGVICKNLLIQDLLDWNFVYAAGRLHKPVRVLRGGNAEIISAMERNYDSALRTALLILPSKFSAEELFCAITALSYTGDPRMGVGENPNKVRNIVRPSIPLFRDMYVPRMRRLEPSVLETADGIFLKDNSPVARSELAYSLPRCLRVSLGLESPLSPTPTAPLRAATVVASPPLAAALPAPPTPAQVSTALAKLVRRSASAQSLKGLLTAGFAKSSIYVFEKVKKRIFHS